MKLTPSQRKYLEAAPIAIFRGRYGLLKKPFKSFSENRCDDLVARGLMSKNVMFHFSIKDTEYTLTETGKKALKEQNGVAA